jgi:putative hemolysin
MDNMPGDPFDFDLPADTPLRRAAAFAVRPLLQRVLRLQTLRKLYERVHALRASTGDENHRDPISFATAALAVLDITAACDREHAPWIPPRGPLIVAANHPHGALDGLVLLDLIGRVRRDVRLVANHLLASIPELRQVCFFVDPFERQDSIHRSLPGLRAAHLWLRQGGALIVFPAGEVAHARGANGAVMDSRWRTTVGRLAIAARARLLPAHIDGANSQLFYVAGRIHPLLRTVLLGRELLKQRGSAVAVRLGPARSSTEVAVTTNAAAAVTAHLRSVVEQIGSRAPITRVADQIVEPVAAAIASADLSSDIGKLPSESKLLTAGAFDVYCAEASQIPHVLDEIGRLRELSFRFVGEGTGRPSDIDAFDGHYLHLFVWNRNSREVVGAYRLGRADLIAASTGVQGLYTRTLFRYDEALLKRLPPALELGRSFVSLEYQRDHSALLLLWKGICAFVQRHPQYRLLFGAVSISARYSDRTREMLMRFLEQNHLDRDLAELVSSCHPYSPVGAPSSMRTPIPPTIEGVDALTARFERDGRRMPVLLRQYLKLNARVLGFNVDPSFADVLDALMMVDLLQVDSRILRRYFGPTGARAYLQHHRAQAA